MEGYPPDHSLCHIRGHILLLVPSCTPLGPPLRTHPQTASRILCTVRLDRVTTLVDPRRFGSTAEYAHPLETLILGMGTIGGPLLIAVTTQDIHMFTVMCWMIFRMLQVSLTPANHLIESRAWSLIVVTSCHTDSRPSFPSGAVLTITITIIKHLPTATPPASDGER